MRASSRNLSAELCTQIRLCFSTESDVSPTRRPTGTRRRQLEWLTNFVLVVVSLFGCSVGAGLLGFYKLHLLQFISIEFVLVPVVLLGAFSFPCYIS